MSGDSQIGYQKLLGIFDVLRGQANNLSLDDLLETIFQKVVELIQCERATIFLVDKETSEIYSRLTSDGKEEIRFPYGQGIAGEAIEQKTSIISASPYDDPRFNSNIDKATGYVTRNILCVPLLNHTNEAIGCIQAINKKNRSFQKSDTELLEVLGKIAANELEFAMTAIKKKMSDIGQMTSGLIHDFKAPMTIIMNATYHLKKESIDVEKRVKYSNIIDSQIDRCVNMIKDVLSYVSGDSEISQLDTTIADFMTTIKENCQPIVADKDIEISYDIQTAPGDMIHIDHQKMMRVFHNLINNSIEAMKDSGKICIGFKKIDQFYEAWVEDTGPGIPEDKHKSIFQPFQTFGKKGGTGLGLSLVTEFCELNGIEISVDGAYKEGARFVMHIPVPSQKKSA